MNTNSFNLRAWDNNKKTWVDNIWNISLHSLFTSGYEVQTASEYNDVEGKRIFIGDFIEVDPSMDSFITESRIYEVKFEDGCFIAACPVDYLAFRYLYEVWSYAKVIGNIFQTPELLR